MAYTAASAYVVQQNSMAEASGFRVLEFVCGHLVGLLGRGASPGLCLHGAPLVRVNRRYVSIVREKWEYTMAMLE